MEELEQPMIGVLGPFRDYFTLVFVSAVGVIQVAAALSGLRGLMFLGDRRMAGLLGTALAVGVFLWYILSAPRNLPDTAGGLSGNQSAWLFSAASATAIAFTLAGSSVVNWRLRVSDHQHESGLDALRSTTFLWAVVRTLIAAWKRP
jgi:hypothetical protein